MNSQDYLNLQEAYIGVYDDDIREKLEFESWVNNLLEEGYDLSDYTWDELYENYTQLDEISQKTATRAFAQRATNEFETDQTSKKSDATKSRIEKKFGTKAGAHAERAAHANIFGRKSSSMPKESYDQQLDEVSDKIVAAVGKRRKKVVSKAFDNYADVSEKPGGTQQLATDISKLNRFKNLEKKRDRRINKESYDLYDLILSHLIDEGYADTQEAAERIMVNMSEDWRESIVETRMDPRGRPASGPMNVYANPKGKPSQARLDAIKSYEDEQRKKTPEQRKKELDDYRERQMNNK